MSFTTRKYNTQNRDYIFADKYPSPDLKAMPDVIDSTVDPHNGFVVCETYVYRN